MTSTWIVPKKKKKKDFFCAGLVSVCFPDICQYIISLWIIPTQWTVIMSFIINAVNNNQTEEKNLSPQFMNSGDKHLQKQMNVTSSLCSNVCSPISFDNYEDFIRLHGLSYKNHIVLFLFFFPSGAIINLVLWFKKCSTSMGYVGCFISFLIENR